jgi:hypothetical protein
MPSLNGEQFGEQLRLFDAPASKVRSQEPEPRYAQLHLPFPVSPPPARKIDWHTPMTQDRWNAHLRMDRSLGGRR